MGGGSVCFAPMRSCGRCLWRPRWWRCGTRCGRRPGSNGRPCKKASMGKEASMVSMTSTNRTALRRIAGRARSLMLALGALMAAMLALWPPAEAQAFCGFYVGRADAQLYNDACHVVMARAGDRTGLSLMNHY